MKLTISEVKAGFKTVHIHRLEVDCKGSGTVDDPAILDPSTELPKSFWIHDSQLHLNIDNCYNHIINLVNSQNITVKNCTLESLNFSNCSNNNVESCQKIKHLGMYMSNNNRINRSTIFKLKMSHSNNNSIQDCTITKIKYRNNNENALNNNQIPEEELLKTKKQPTFVSLNLFKIINAIMVIAFYIGFISMMIAYPFFFELGILILIFFTFTFFILPRIIKYCIKKRRETNSRTNI